MTHLPKEQAEELRALETAAAKVQDMGKFMPSGPKGKFKPTKAETEWRLRQDRVYVFKYIRGLATRRKADGSYCSMGFEVV